MKVSVIVPCCNAEAYLAACLSSIAAQTMPDFEAILVDDGSTDATAEIAAGFAARDGRFRLIRQENRGVSAARNRALRGARGEWITFVDADDLLPEGALAALLEEAKPDVHMVVGLHETFDASGRAELARPEGGWQRRHGAARQRAVALRLIEGDSVLNIMCGKLHRRGFLAEQCIALREGVRIAEDALFNLEAVLLGGAPAYVGRSVYRYRMNDASAMHRAAGNEWQRHLPWLVAMKDMLLARGAMEAFYGAFADSAALRLYKDGGFAGVRAHWGELKSLIDVDGLDESRMAAADRRRLRLVKRDAYPGAYPLIAAGAAAGRRLSAFADALAGRAKP